MDLVNFYRRVGGIKHLVPNPNVPLTEVRPWLAKPPNENEKDSNDNNTKHLANAKVKRTRGKENVGVESPATLAAAAPAVTPKTTKRTSSTPIKTPDDTPKTTKHGSATTVETPKGTKRGSATPAETPKAKRASTTPAETPKKAVDLTPAVTPVDTPAETPVDTPTETPPPSRTQTPTPFGQRNPFQVKN